MLTEASSKRHAACDRSRASRRVRETCSGYRCLNYADPFGLCSVKEWTDCKVWSISLGLRLGAGFKARAGGARVEAGTPSIGLTAELSTGARGHSGEAGLRVEGWSAGVQLGSFTFGTEVGGCSDITACSDETSGDVSTEATLGIVRVGVTVHAKQAATYAVGATLWAARKIAGYIKERATPQPDDDP